MQALMLRLRVNRDAQPCSLLAVQPAAIRCGGEQNSSSTFAVRCCSSPLIPVPQTDRPGLPCWPCICCPVLKLLWGVFKGQSRKLSNQNSWSLAKETPGGGGASCSPPCLCSSGALPSLPCPCSAVCPAPGTVPALSRCSVAARSTASVRHEAVTALSYQAGESHVSYPA